MALSAGEVYALVQATLDSDGDGIPNDQDAFPDSDVSPTITIGGVDLGIENILFDDGSTMIDWLDFVIDESLTHDELQTGIAALTNEWKSEGLISGKEKGVIQRTTAKLSVE